MDDHHDRHDHHDRRPGPEADPGENCGERAALEAGLQRLGIRELEQRMEVAPLLTDQPLVPLPQDADMPCCVCKLTDPSQLDDGGMLPYPTMDK